MRTEPKKQRAIPVEDRGAIRNILHRLRNESEKLPSPFKFPPPYNESCRKAFCELGNAINACDVQLTLLMDKEEDDADES